MNVNLSPLHSGIQGRLLLILGLATLAILAASAMALVALNEIRARVADVTERELPASNAALVLARVGERLQDRTPALMAAKGPDARRLQADLIHRDLVSLADETERLRGLNPAAGGVDDISRLAPKLAGNLRDLALLLERQANLGAALQGQRDRLIALRERVQQTLGPSILAVSAVVGRGQAPEEGLFRGAAVVQGPLLDAERLMGSALSELLIAAEAPAADQVRLARGAFERTRDQLSALVPRLPAGLRPGVQDAVADLASQLKGNGVFALREGELAAIAGADNLVSASRDIATGLKARVDALVRSANENIARATDAMGSAILTNTLWFIAVSVAAVLLATLLSYRFVVRDISLNLRAVTRAMQRLADGEREARVPAQERRDEIGDLARVFNVFKDQAFRMETLDRELAEQSGLLLATFDHMNDGLSVCDAQGRLIAWNPRFLRLYGLEESEAAAGTPLARIHEVLAGRGARAFTTLGEPVELGALSQGRTTVDQQFEIRCADGRLVELRSNPMPNGGFVTIHLDVSERRAVEGQLRQAQKMEAVGQLTGGIAHDFNNILAAIQGNLTFLEAGLGKAPALRERWERAMAATDRAARQVGRLLAFSRRQRLEPEVVDINALVTGMTDLLEYSLGAGIELRTALAPDLPAVRIDPGQLEDALMNLAINARDAMQGEGRIDYATTRVDGGAIEIAVRDSGCGMTPELQERVFEPFFTTKAAGKGSGLGLSMVYGFVRQSGGGIAIDSAPGQGTTVRIRLPVAAATDPSGGTVPDAAGQETSPTGAGKTLLVVDDDLDLLTVTADRLRALGYRVLTAADGAAALRVLDQAPEVRLLYTDVVMPLPWDGPALAREALARRPGLAILFTSAEPRDLMDPSCELLRKPVPGELLARSVRRLLDD